MTLQDDIAILNQALNLLDVIPATAPFAGIAQIVLVIITAAVSRIKSQSGKPIDLMMIPVEQPIP